MHKNKKILLTCGMFFVIILYCFSYRAEASNEQYEYGNLVWGDSYFYGYEIKPEVLYQNNNSQMYVEFNLNNYTGVWNNFSEQGQALIEIKEYSTDITVYSKLVDYTVGCGNALIPISDLKANVTYSMRILLNNKSSSYKVLYNMVTIVKNNNKMYFGFYGKNTVTNYNAYKNWVESLEKYPAKEYMLSYRAGKYKSEQKSAVFANQLVEGVTNEYEKAVIISNWIYANIVYTDNLSPRYNNADDVLLNKKGQCTEFSELLRAMLNAVDIPCVYVSSAIDNHAWNMAYIDSHWICFDSTWDTITENILSAIGYHTWTDAIAEVEKVSSIQINNRVTNISKGSTLTLNVDIIPTYALNRSITWSSSDANVVSVDANGTITANNYGEAIIKATANDTEKVYSSFSVIVMNDSSTTDFKTGWSRNEDGELCNYRDGKMVTNEFAFDGSYTYYLQADGTPMKNRLTYHPDGVHLIYLDENGHELFNTFKYCKSVGYTCYFDSNGYLYKDKITFINNKPYYLDGDGRMRQTGWFRFANGVDYGYANGDGTLLSSGFSYDPWGRVVFYHWNGMVARGLISDGAWYYNMSTTDGHYLGQFPVH